MATTVQQIADRAKAFSTANTSASISDAAEIIARVGSTERQLYVEASQLRPDFFLATGTLTSTAAASARVATLSSLASPVLRVVQVRLTATDEVVSQVDLLDTDGELAPRYIAKGQTLVEVSDDWNTASSAAQSLTVDYIAGPAVLSTTGSLTQTVSLPDEWADCLVLPLALYLAHKDVGRNPDEIARLAALGESVKAQFLTYLTQYAGVGAMRFTRAGPDLKKARETP